MPGEFQDRSLVEAIQSIGLHRVGHEWATITSLQILYGPTLTSIHGWWKNHGFDYADLCQQSDVSVFFLFFVFFFNILSKFVIAFLPRSKCLLISWLQSPSAVILEPKKIKSTTVSVTDIRRNIFENGRLVCLWPYQVHTDTKYLWQMFMAPFLHPVKR